MLTECAATVSLAWRVYGVWAAELAEAGGLSKAAQDSWARPWGGSYDSVHWNEFGYPAAGMFNGQVMVEADSSTGTTGGFGSRSDTVQVGNDMTGGSSGGPWIRYMFPNQYGNSQNLANGANSFGPNGRPFATGSP